MRERFATEFKAVTEEFLGAHNENAKPFVWTK